ncbi:MAG: M14 family metallocarboxypeptidase [Clostridia bacterium]|nr:M14 family metallocarboxypeptidase [Clostridia bacterium]
MQRIHTNASYTYELFMEDLRALTSAFSCIESGTAGYSVLGKSIPFLRFGKGRHKVLITGAHHGKEWITAMLNMAIAEVLCQLYTERKRIGETDLAVFFDTHTIYMLPMVNPDGVNLCIRGLSEDIPPFIRSRLIGMNAGSQDFVGKWQANIRGVDLNHNYDALFEKGRTMAFAKGIYGPCSSQYSGEYPESEPETQAVTAFTKAIKPDVVIAYHSQGEEIFYSFNGTCAKGAKALAQTLAQATGYNLSEAQGITDCSGYKDWVIDKFSIPAYTIEVGKGENPLPLSQFEKILHDNLNAILRL